MTVRIDNYITGHENETCHEFFQVKDSASIFNRLEEFAPKNIYVYFRNANYPDGKKIHVSIEKVTLNLKLTSLDRDFLVEETIPLETFMWFEIESFRVKCSSCQRLNF